MRPDDTTCRRCGRPVSGLRRGGRPSRYCSPECRAQARRERAAVLGPVASTPFATVLGRAVAASGLPLRSVERRLAEFGATVAASTVDEWRHGVRPPADSADALGWVLALERVLGVPAGDLVVTLDWTRRGALLPGYARCLAQVTGCAGRPGAEFARRHAGLQRRVAALRGRQLLVPVRVRTEHEIGLDHRPMRSTVTQVVRAAHDEVDRLWFVHAFSRRLYAEVLPAVGCRLGRVLLDRPAGGDDPVLAAAELLFDDVLERGRRYRLCFTVVYAHGHQAALPDPVFRQVQGQPCERVELRLGFAPGVPPAAVRQHRWTTGPVFTELDPAARVPLDAAGARLERTDAPPAAVGWSWRWPGDAGSE